MVLNNEDYIKLIRSVMKKFECSFIDAVYIFKFISGSLDDLSGRLRKIFNDRYNKKRYWDKK